MNHMQKSGEQVVRAELCNKNGASKRALFVPSPTVASMPLLARSDHRLLVDATGNSHGEEGPGAEDHVFGGASVEQVVDVRRATLEDNRPRRIVSETTFGLLECCRSRYDDYPERAGIRVPTAEGARSEGLGRGTDVNRCLRAADLLVQLQLPAVAPLDDQILDVDRRTNNPVSDDHSASRRCPGSTSIGQTYRKTDC